MKIIIVQGWDCCPYTHSVWANEYMHKFAKVDLGNFDNDSEPKKLIAALKEAGFKQIKPQVVTFGGNL